MQGLDLSADFLAWAGNIPFLVTWELDRGRGRWCSASQITTSRIAGHLRLSRYEFPADAVAHYGLLAFAGQFDTIMQKAQEAEAAIADGR